MGNFSSILWPSYTALSEQRIEQTELQYYIDLASALLKSRIVHVSNEFFGDAANLLKPEKCKTLKDIDGERDGWQTQRHIDSASVTIRFGIHGLIRGFDIDTTSFDDACPVSVTIEAARSMRKGEQSQWDIVLPNVEIQPNRHNLYTINDNKNVYSEVRVTMPSAGGIARLRCYGTPQPSLALPRNDSSRPLNLASILHGARVISCSDERYDIKPNVLLEGGKRPEEGWETPHSRGFDRNDSLVIKLAARAKLENIQISTKGFVGNAPEFISIKGCLSSWNDPEAQWEEVPWVELSPKQPIEADKVNNYKVVSDQEISHIKFTMYPDGGIQNISVFGNPTTGDVATATKEIDNVNHATEDEIPTPKSMSPESSQPSVAPDESTTGRKRGRSARRTIVRETTTIEEDVIRARRPKRSRRQ